MEAPECRRELGAVLAEQAAVLAELATYLEREHEYLAANEVAALESAIRERQHAVGRVVRAEEQRAALCAKLGRTPDGRGLREILRSCDSDGSLAAEWARCRAAAAKCRALNDRNAALAGARLRHVQARLAALFSGRGEAVGYGRGGEYALKSIGRVVKVEA